MRTSHHRAAWLAATLLFAVVLLLSPAAAHPPKAVDLVYDAEMKLLKVSIIHTSHFPSAHYVITVDVKKNGKTVCDVSYTEQPKTNPFTYTYAVQAEGGDILKVTATCNVFGSTTASIKVPTKAVTGIK